MNSMGDGFALLMTNKTPMASSSCLGISCHIPLIQYIYIYTYVWLYMIIYAYIYIIYIYNIYIIYIIYNIYIYIIYIYIYILFSFSPLNLNISQYFTVFTSKWLENSWSLCPAGRSSWSSPPRKNGPFVSHLAWHPSDLPTCFFWGDMVGLKQ